ncbi:PEPxxWA-CTERM sorting domain-containing protein [Sphingomonas piscis]|uniref:PEPxxWA-CTERM sorting domain-containing protein n=1 Tax=Sphingomonas piscis TaxID=2714943 RepID=A0A6G7YQU0_9SPHN|nr:PEPxxWA-CTERM sorting domain-containing protein [Sphingomonas piscis]
MPAVPGFVITPAPPTTIVGPASPVPEPNTWTSILVGFGTAGSLLRRRRRVARGSEKGTSR